MDAARRWMYLVIAIGVAGLVFLAESQQIATLIDGDTLRLASGETIRILGIDAPETSRAKCPEERVQGEAALTFLAQGLKRPELVERMQCHALHVLRQVAREFEVLWELMTPAGRVCSKRDLALKLSEWDEVLADNALEAFISRLRKKLAGSGAQIRTLRGLGYVLEAEA